MIFSYEAIAGIQLIILNRHHVLNWMEMSIVLVGNGSVKIRVEKASHELIEGISRNKKIILRMHIDSASNFLYSVYRGYL